MSATITALFDPAPWMTRAACRGMDPEIFFPTKGRSPAEALAVCRRCPVFDDCVDYAVRNRIREGVWGVTVEERRRRFRLVPPASRRREPFHGTPARYRRGCRCLSCRLAAANHRPSRPREETG